MKKELFAATISGSPQQLGSSRGRAGEILALARDDAATTPLPSEAVAGCGACERWATLDSPSSLSVGALREHSAAAILATRDNLAATTAPPQGKQRLASKPSLPRRFLGFPPPPLGKHEQQGGIPGSSAAATTTGLPPSLPTSAAGRSRGSKRPQRQHNNRTEAWGGPAEPCSTGSPRAATLYVGSRGEGKDCPAPAQGLQVFEDG